MPSVSKAQQRLMGAAEHGATFPMAKQLRGSMTHQQLHDFAATKLTNLPTHVKPKTVASPKVKPPKVSIVAKPPNEPSRPPRKADVVMQSSYGKAPKAAAVHPFVHHAGGKGY
jgi:hypothetical protein